MDSKEIKQMIADFEYDIAKSEAKEDNEAVVARLQKEKNCLVELLRLSEVEDTLKRYFSFEEKILLSYDDTIARQDVMRKLKQLVK